MRENIKHKTLNAVFWESLSNFIRQIIDFIVIVIFARFVSPEYFGGIAVVGFLIKIFTVIKETGLTVSIVQKEKVNDEYLSTAFHANFFIGALFFCAVFFGAGFLANAFKMEFLASLIRVGSLVFLIEPLTYVNLILLIRGVGFKKIMIAETAAAAVYAFCAIGLLLCGAGLVSFAWGLVAASVARTVLFLKLKTWTPKMVFDFRSLRDLFRFGAAVWSNRVIQLAFYESDIVIVAFFLGPLILGYYSLARKIVMFFMNNIRAVLSRVLFSVFSRIKNNLALSRQYYSSTVFYAALLSVPLYVIVVCLSRPLIVVMFGSKWLPALMPLRILCLAGVLNSLRITAGPMLYAQGAPRLVFHAGAIAVLARVIMLFVLLERAAAGAAAAVAFSELIIFLQLNITAGRWLRLNPGTLLLRIFPIIVSAGGTALLLAVFNEQIDGPLLFAEVVLALFCYAVFLKMLGVDIRGRVYDFFAALSGKGSSLHERK